MHGMNNIIDLGQYRYGHITSTAQVTEEAAAAGRLSNFHATGYYAPHDQYVIHGTDPFAWRPDHFWGPHIVLRNGQKGHLPRGTHTFPLVPTLNEIRPVRELPACF
jgi:hypothetical protein